MLIRRWATNLPCPLYCATIPLKPKTADEADLGMQHHAHSGGVVMGVTQVELAKLPPGMQTLLDRVPPEYMHDLALDLAWAALVAPRRPDALYQMIQRSRRPPGMR
jgi:hypothetical protein